MPAVVDDLFHNSPTPQRCAADVISAGELRTMFSHERPLRIKYGVDVTAPFLHIGHAVNLWAMRELHRPDTRWSC
jgi:tyrosyl-tRNA synthetase